MPISDDNRRALVRLADDPDAYDIMATLRGPDMAPSEHAWLLKYIFTGRLRALLGLTYDGAATRTEPLSKNEAGMFLRWASKPHPELGHFLRHIESAAYALGDPNLASLAWKAGSNLAGVPTVDDIICLAGGRAAD